MKHSAITHVVGIRLVWLLVAALAAPTGQALAGEPVLRTSSATGTSRVSPARGSSWAAAQQAIGEPIYILTSAHSSGAAGTNWRTDLEVHNPGNATASFTIALLKRDSWDNDHAPTKSFSLPAHRSAAYPDVVLQQFSFSGAAALRVVTTSGGVLVSSRTYNDQPGGTFGQLVPGLTVSEAFGAGEEARLVQLSHDPSGTAGYRTNIGVVNPAGRTVALTIKLYDASGTLLGTVPTGYLMPYAYTQYDKVFEKVTTGKVDDGYAVITANAAFYAFASVIDNHTGDPVFIPARRAPLATPLYLATAAHVAGAAGTNWRSDVEVHNAGTTQATFSIALLKRGQVNASPVTQTFTIEPGRSALYGDVIDSVFHFQGAAALRVTPLVGSVQVNSRTYNQRSDGTFGQLVPALADAMAFEAGEQARLVQLAQSASLTSGYRTNIGLVNASAVTGTVEVALYAADGTLLGTLPAQDTTLRPYEYRQIDQAFGKVTSAAVDDGFAVVSTRTSGGRFFAYASVIDNRTGDPVLVPAQRAATGFTVRRQFLESSYNWNDLAMVSPAVGFAVGEPHWDQVAKAFVGTITKTSDGGQTWEAQDVPAAATLKAVSFADAATGWAVGESGTVLKTSNGGATWVPQAIASTDSLDSVVFVDAQHGWLTTLRETHYDFVGDADDWDAGVWHTMDGGSTWVQQTVPDDIAILHAITFVTTTQGWAVGVRRTATEPYPEHRAVILHTADGGTTWQTQYASDLQISLTAVDFLDASKGWAVGFATSSALEGGTILHTADGGLTWMRQQPSDAFGDVEFVDANRGYAVGMDYASAWGTPVQRTMDGGATWEKLRQAKQDNEALRGLTVFADRVIAVGDHDFVSRASDPWGNAGAYNGDELFTQHYASIHYKLEDIAFAGADNGWAVGRRSYEPGVWGQVILHTPDGGETWQTQYEKAPAEGSDFSVFRLDAVTFVTPLEGWAVGRSELFSGATQWLEPHGAIMHTSDGGLHWVEQGRELAGTVQPEFTAVQFPDATHGWALEKGHLDIATGSSLFLARTSDGGSHWQWVSTGLDGSITVGYEIVMGGVAFPDAQHGWAVGGLGQVLATSDGGAHWQKQELGCGYPSCPTHMNNVAFASNQTGFIAAESGLYVTSDGGAHWLSRELGAGPVDYNEVQFPTRRVGWVAGGWGALYTSPDAGLTWLRVPTPTSLDLLGLHFVSATHGFTVGTMGEILEIQADAL
ncbi:MAG TPA: YCF48-related protein [Thermoanaerobaculaceae bacterium]|nr:YCF48-related protein [Thermoanaerobaculaceae bacterium]HPS77405.1 YCF48-related protein [Thermoanaerobaculaceae bacterium]